MDGSIWIIVSLVLGALFVAHRARRARVPAPRLEMIERSGRCSIAAVGESHYRAAFEAICGVRTGEGEHRSVVAMLVREPSNPYDPNAIAVYVEGRKVAHLSRAHAIQYRTLVEGIEARGRSAACVGVIRGGWVRDGVRADYGIWLDLPAPGSHR